jgi:predicted DNA-binding ribbon-helix-helix protein
LYRVPGAALWGHDVERIKRKRSRNIRNIKRSIKIDGQSTSVSLEDAFWNALKEIATTCNVPVFDLIATINKAREHSNLSSVLRLFVLEHYRAQADARRSAEGPIEKDHPVRSGRP